MIKPVIPLLLHAARYGWDSLAFQINDQCTGCATCSKVCPVDNIIFDDGRPVWEETA